jgi:hypothetical protein
VSQATTPRCVILDNLSAHKVTGIDELVKARSAQSLYLPKNLRP